MDKVRKLFESGKCDVNCVDWDGWTPLHEAAFRGHLGVVRVLISDFKADINAHAGSGRTPFHLAAHRGQLDVVRVLISEFKVDVNVHDKDGRTPLHWAASGGHLDVVRVLISEFKAYVGAHDESGMTPLHLAVKGGHLGVVRVLISEFKTDINICTNNISTPFDMAVNSDRKEVAMALINEFHCDTKEGTPYIHKACEQGWVDLVRALVQKHGISILKDDENSCNALFDVAVINNREEMAVALMNEFHCVNKGGTPLIHTACKKGWVNLVRALVQKHGSNILKDARDSKGNTPLHIAAMSGSEDVVSAFINEFSCDVNVTGYLGRSLLHSACFSKNGSLVRFVSQYISSWVVDDNGDTPLHICAFFSYSDCVKALLEVDPPVMIRNNSGRTPKDLEQTFARKGTVIGSYMKENKDKIYSQYEVVQMYAKKKYSLP